jgi:hypothetical protein
MKSDAQRQQARRERMRRDGFVLRQVWVHPQDWPIVREQIARINSKRKK